jgi:PPP family 3-phenylpropionic acid transporter
MTPDVKPEKAVVGVFLLFGVMIAAFFPFFALFLKDKGLSDGRIGLGLAAMALARVLTAPVWGHLADTRFGRLRVMQIGLIAASAAALALFLADGFVAIAVVAFVFAAATTATGPNIDAIALAHLGEARMGDYSRLRSLESLSYAVACLVYGLILEASGVRWSMIIYSIASMVLLAWSQVIRPDAPKGSTHGGRLGTVGAVFRVAPRFPLYLLAMLLVWSGFNAAWNFFSLRIEAAGGGPLLVGIGTALGGAIEVPVMLMSGRLHRTLGLRKTWVFGALVYAFAFVLWGVVNEPRIISALTVLEGIGFAFLFTSGVVIVGKLVPKELYSTGQSISGMVGFGLAPILGAGFGGFLLERLGPIWLYSIAALLALCGAAVGWIALRGSDLTQGLDAVEAIVEPSP